MLTGMASGGADSYFRLLAEWHRHDDYATMFRRTLRELASEVIVISPSPLTLSFQA